MPLKYLPRAPAPLGARRGQLSAETQVLTEPARIIGRSGRVYAELGENSRDERLHITPIGRAFRPKHERGRVQKYATGGELLALGLNPNDPEVKRMVASGQISAATPTSSITYQTPVGYQIAREPGQPARNPMAPPLISTTTYGAVGQAQYGAAQALLASQQAQIAANRGVLGAQQAQLGTQRGAFRASSAYLDEQARAVESRRKEEEAIQAAARNTEDIVATARAQRERDVNAYKYDIAGLPRPRLVRLAPGEQLEQAPPGVEQELETQESLLTRQAANTEALRQGRLENARIGAARANQRAQEAGLDVDAAQIEAQRAGLDVNQANLNLRRAEMPPAPGLVFDDETGNFVSQADYRIRQAQRGIEYDEVNRVFVARQELLDRTDKAGNVLRLADNVWVSPQGNELINGIWTDPQTGNVFDPQRNAWISPDGFIFYIDNPRTGAGHWEDPQGFILQADGIWRHPVTGDYKIHGIVYQGRRGGEYSLDSNFDEGAGGADEGLVEGETGAQPISTGAGSLPPILEDYLANSEAFFSAPFRR